MTPTEPTGTGDELEQGTDEGSGDELEQGERVEQEGDREPGDHESHPVVGEGEPTTP